MSESLPADSGWTESDPPPRETAGKNAAAEEQLAEEGERDSPRPLSSALLRPRRIPRSPLHANAGSVLGCVNLLPNLRARSRKRHVANAPTTAAFPSFRGWDRATPTRRRRRTPIIGRTIRRGVTGTWNERKPLRRTISIWGQTSPHIVKADPNYATRIDVERATLALVMVQ